MDETTELVAQESGVHKIVEVAQQAAGMNVVVGDANGHLVSTVPLYDATLEDPEPSPLVLHSLTGLIAYLESNRDELPTEDLMVHVAGPRRVDVVSDLRGLEQRFTYVRAECRDRMSAARFAFGRFMLTEALNISLQALFRPSHDRPEVLKLIGTVTDEAVRTEKDDGVTQKVTAKAGVALEDNVEVPNPVTLAPFRTFTEVEQPESPFVLRVRKTDQGVQGALFEADGGAWRHAAVHRIRKYLEERLNKGITIIA